ncbi:hypothetical protein [Alkalibacillus haloalkaliphilus]|nr:hypothetical protein [Alkalibacillus haloalkaliphilus]MDV2580727.1 hypothetical protein [Alkalibacillus haloalkaliphilus]
MTVIVGLLLLITIAVTVNKFRDIKERVDELENKFEELKNNHQISIRKDA